jgi:NADPH:quinone reductase-like Zn-dependent oxidoreductase
MTKQSTMRAGILETHNAPLRISTISTPEIGPREVLVRVRASGVNPLDTKIHAGAAPHARHPLPAIPGIDLAGVVEQTGREVSRFKPGDEVYGMTGGVGGVQGSLAEFAAVDADLLALKPANLSMREAAALPLIFITAWEGLIDRAALKPGQKVLIHGGAGGVGHVAIQIARAFGAEVFATGSASQRATIEGFGAVFIDRDTAVEAYVAEHTGGRGFDIVYDTVGGKVLDASFAAVRRFGHVVSALGWAHMRWRRCRSAPPPIPACSHCCRCSQAKAARITGRSWRRRHGSPRPASWCRCSMPGASRWRALARPMR